MAEYSKIGTCQTLRYRKVRTRAQWREYGWKLEGQQKQQHQLLEQGFKKLVKNKCEEIEETIMWWYLEFISKFAWSRFKRGKFIKLMTIKSNTSKKICWTIDLKIHCINNHKHACICVFSTYLENSVIF